MEAVRKYHRNQLAVSCLSVLQLQVSPFIFPVWSSRPARESDSKEVSPDWPPDMCPSTPLISASIESEQMARWPSTAYTTVIGQERMMRLAQTPEGWCRDDLSRHWKQIYFVCLCIRQQWTYVVWGLLKHNLLYIDLDTWWEQQRARHQEASLCLILFHSVFHFDDSAVIVLWSKKKNLPQEERWLWTGGNRSLVEFL